MSPPKPTASRTLPLAESSAWATPLLGCLRGKDVGPNCCFQHVCCGPCIWGDALRKAGVENAELFTLAQFCGDSSLVDEAAGFFARRRLAKKYGITESPLYSTAATFCCAPCARVQEVNTVLTREDLHYGCATTVPDTRPNIVAPPAPKTMQRQRAKRHI